MLKLKELGNSLGAFFPKGTVREEGLRENQAVLAELVRKAGLTPVFGTLKRKMTGQQLKGMARKGWQ